VVVGCNGVTPPHPFQWTNEMIDNLPREADALPTLRSNNWLIPLLLAMALTGWVIICGVLWVFKLMANVAIAVGGLV
jgi:hypothetical protein